MDKLKINFISPSNRCEICHQSDCYNPQTNYCSRCDNVTNQNHRNSYITSSHTAKIVLGVIAAFITLFSIIMVIPNLLSSGHGRIGASAVEAMRLYHSVEVTYQAGVGKGEFGTAEELLCQELIDPVLARATGVLKSDCYHSDERSFLISKSGYIFRLTTTKSAPNKPAGFSVVGICLDKDAGNRNFFVDETGVIRASNNISQIPDINSKPIGN